MVDIKIIKSPSQGAVEMLGRRRSLTGQEGPGMEFDTIGLIQGKLIDMIVAADIAEKAANVHVEEIRGVCPQHFILLAVFGDTASVEAALVAVGKRINGVDEKE